MYDGRTPDAVVEDLDAIRDAVKDKYKYSQSQSLLHSNIKFLRVSQKRKQVLRKDSHVGLLTGSKKVSQVLSTQLRTFAIWSSPKYERR
ncbi:uncharacterized protein PHALS_15007 [Plasmopara halstedii]|uniref:Uncharacterized protein n=1 Tax=Plasmopara halstedii TaxID=4781 RepID=A0A0N7L7M6_PLAHL|nr:uncharacterized protein PHALS_15007 [Plasmopara halstedii]CEG47499.1 hypothetical protein PHALS_15007 [Plasmopara halstedii]|eukprot:XP_024583868.1 hypothetical protein PHALS_15007 [Plasmopara halstedii]